MASPKKSAVGDLLRAARQEIRFTQEDFSVELGVSRRTLSRWEGGGSPPSRDELPWVVRVFQKFDRGVAERLGAQLGVNAIPPVFTAALNGALVAAAASLGVSPSRLRGVLEPLVEEWRASGATMEEIGAWLRAPAGDGKR